MRRPVMHRYEVQIQGPAPAQADPWSDRRTRRALQWIGMSKRVVVVIWGVVAVDCAYKLFLVLVEIARWAVALLSGLGYLGHRL
jgi:hypothetical protein